MNRKRVFIVVLPVAALVLFIYGSWSWSTSQATKNVRSSFDTAMTVAILAIKADPNTPKINTSSVSTSTSLTPNFNVSSTQQSLLKSVVASLNDNPNMPYFRLKNFSVTMPRPDEVGVNVTITYELFAGIKRTESFAKIYPVGQ